MNQSADSTPPDRPRPPTSVFIATVAQLVAGVVIIIGAAAESFGPAGLTYTRWFLGVGGFGLLAGIGLYLQVGLARATSFLFAASTAILGVIALAFGAEGGSPLWQYFAIGLVTLCGIVSLVATGQWRPFLEWGMRDN